MSPSLERRTQAALRIVLSHYVTNGLSVALGLLLISGAVHFWWGPFASAAASVGVIAVVPADAPSPRRNKFWQLMPGTLISTPLFFGVQVLHTDALRLGMLLVSATFVAFLGAAWGKRGLPISISIMFALIFSLALPAHPGYETALSTTLYFALGAGTFLLYSTLANALLNARYRVLVLADTLFSVATLMRTQAQQFTPAATDANERKPLIGRLLQQQAALADNLQSARNLLLESPSSPRRQQLASMLVQLLEMRDHLMACELDLEPLHAHGGQMPVLSALRSELEALAEQIDHLADALLLGRQPALFESQRAWPTASNPPADNSDNDAPAAAPSPAMLARGLASRVGYIHEELLRLIALARNEGQPDLAAVRANWQMFISPTGWSWQPLSGLWHWDAPPLRHAIRAALAIGSAQALSLVLPWGTHDYWILLTIAVVLRGSLAQTLERRNTRVAGTLLGCVVSVGLLSIHTPPLALLVMITLAQGVAHAFAIRNYLVTVVAATVLALLQAHLLNAGGSPAFEVIERMADTLIGVAIAWAFSYVLPSWERTQIPALVSRVLAAQAQHARLALGLGQLKAVDNASELGWRLARREVYDSLSALVQATQRSLSEPRAVRPPLVPLGRMLAHSYQLLAQLTAVKTMLLLRRGRLDAEHIGVPLKQAADAIEATLSKLPEPFAESSADASAGSVANTVANTAADTTASPGPVALPDPFESNLTPWLLRRLHLAGGLAQRLCGDAQQVLQASSRGQASAGSG